MEAMLEARSTKTRAEGSAKVAILEREAGSLVDRLESRRIEDEAGLRSPSVSATAKARLSRDEAAIEKAEAEISSAKAEAESKIERAELLQEARLRQAEQEVRREAARVEAGIDQAGERGGRKLELDDQTKAILAGLDRFMASLEEQ